MEHERDSYTKQLAMIRELDALGSARGSHALNTVTQRYKAYKRNLDSYEKIKQLVQQTVNDLEVVLITYFNILLKPDAIHKLDFNPPLDESVQPLIDECDLIENHIVGNTADYYYTPVKFAKQEIDNSFIQVHNAAMECQDLLKFYSQVMRFYPHRKLMQSHLIKYKKTFTELMGQTDRSISTTYDETHSTESCTKYLEQMILVYTEIQNDLTKAQVSLEQSEQDEEVSAKPTKANKYTSHNFHFLANHRHSCCDEIHR